MLDLRRLILLTALAVGVTACGPSGSTASQAASLTASLIPAATSPAATGASASGQADTEWGRIWETLPAGFPTFPGSTPSDEASADPASAILVVDGNVAKAVVTTTESKLKALGYGTDALSGPLEDGSYTLEMTGSPAGCRLMVTARPTGGLTTVTILYGSGCPTP